MIGKYAQKNFGAVGAMAPTPLSLKTRRGGEGGGGGGLGGVAYKDRARPPPSDLCFFHPIWVLGARGGGGLIGDWYTTCLCSLSPWTAQKSELSKLIFLIL